MSLVVHLITGLHVGGAERMLQKLLGATDRKRFRSVVVTLLGDVGTIGKEIKALGIAVHSLGLRRGRPSVRAIEALARLLRSERPQILQSWMYHADLLGLICGKLCRVPHIVWNVRCSERGQEASRTTAWTIKACAKFSGWPDAVIINSEAGRRFHAESGYRPRRWKVIPNGFQLDRFLPDPGARASVRVELGIPADALLIGLIARIDPSKDHQNFLRGAGLLATRRPNVHFLLAGGEVTSSNSALTRLMAAQGVEKCCHLLGERSDVPRLMASLDILSSSSSFEGFSNSIGEAMACGVPCVVTDVGDSAQIVGETGIVVPPGDPQALLDAWERLLSAGADARRALGDAARRRVEEHFSLDRIVQKYEHFYSSLLAG